MKNIKLSLLSLLAAITLSGCSFFNGHGSDEPDDPTLEKTQLAYTYKDYISNNVYDVDSAPNIGKAKLLVIPVWFSDSSSYISTTNKEKIRKDIEKAYFGSNSETGWRSVKTFYEEESNNKLQITGVVSDWYSINKKSSSCTEDDTNNIVTSAVNWYKTQSGDSTLKSFDADENGHLDGVMLIYGAPDYTLKGNNDNLWAYCYWLQNNDANISSPTPNVFFWASYDFMYGEENGYGNYRGGDTSHCKIDAHTFIHEMGHVFGLEDYYDYSGKYNPAAGFSMQDYNIGGHDPYSVMALGWADPYIPSESTTITIKPFQSSHDVILLANHNVDSPFDEYLLVELYTPTGLNEFDSKYSYCGNYPKGPNVAGIRLWHIDARLLYTRTGRYDANKVTTNPLIKDNYVAHMMSNTYYSTSASSYCSPLGRDYADYDILHYIRRGTSSTYLASDNLASTVMFKTGDVFQMDSYKKQFVKSGLLDSGSELGWKINFKSVSDSNATIELTKLN